MILGGLESGLGSGVLKKGKRALLSAEACMPARAPAKGPIIARRRCNLGGGVAVDVTGGGRPGTGRQQLIRLGFFSSFFVLCLSWAAVGS
ncbi:hypothetical protein V6Z11_A03G198500 [Gossypium hirsutum]